MVQMNFSTIFEFSLDAPVSCKVAAQDHRTQDLLTFTLLKIYYIKCIT